MAFIEVRFPVDISLGSRGGPGFRTQITTSDSGSEQRISRWSQARRQYDVSYGIKSQALLSVVIDFFHARMGAAHGFRYKDWLDFTTGANHNGAYAFNDVQIAVGDGSTTVFQLTKAYSSGGSTHTRTIFKPVSGAVKSGVNGVEKTIGVDFTVDVTAGTITYTVAPPSTQAVTWGGEFDVPVRFDEIADSGLGVAFEDFDIRSIPSIGLIEITNVVPQEDEFFYGGAFEFSMGANVTLSYLNGRVQVFQATTSGLSVQLPNPTNIIPGGPIFYLVNEASGSNAVTLKDHNGATMVGSFGVGTTVEIFLSEDPIATKVWYAK